MIFQRLPPGSLHGAMLLWLTVKASLTAYVPCPLDAP